MTHGSLNIEVFNDAMFQENGMVVWTAGSSACWIIDPGLPPQPEEMLAFLESRGLSAGAIVLTHCHADHIAGVGPLRGAMPGVTIVAPREERHMLSSATANLSAAMGLPITAPDADRCVRPGDREVLDGLEWRVLDVSGHSPGGVAYYCAAAGVVLAGDALFAGSIGRFDFPGSSGERLIRNIREHLLSLPDETVVYPGHGPATTIGRERRTNPYLSPEFAP